MNQHVFRIRNINRYLLLCLLVFRPDLLSLHADDSPRTLAVVNGVEITESDLEFLYLSRDVREELRASVRERFIDQLIDRSLLKQFLDERGIRAPESVVNERVARAEKLITRENLDFDDTLKKLGYTRESFRDEVALPLAWLEHARLAITDSAITQYWENHRSKFDGTEVHAAHIVKRASPDAGDEETARIKQQLAGLRQSIVAGETTFADAAEKHSDSPSAKDGGDLGQFAWRGRMPQNLTDVAFRLQPGEVSEPFESPFGVHLLTVTGIVPGDLSLEDARGEIFQELSSKLQSGLIAQLRKKAGISKPAQNSDATQ